MITIANIMNARFKLESRYDIIQELNIKVNELNDVQSKMVLINH